MSLTFAFSRSTLRGRTRAQTPMPILPVMVRAEAVTKEVEAFVPSITNHGLRLVEGKPQLVHYHPRPRQRLTRMTATEDDEVSGAGEFHPRALAETDVKLSPHPAPIVRPRPPMSEQIGVAARDALQPLL
jgi:hypothetical protein